MKAVLLVLSLTSLNGLDCLISPFPKVLGGQNGDTNINQIDIRTSTDDIVAAGYTNDGSIKGIAVPYEIPMIALYEGHTHSQLWGFFLGLSRYMINAVTFSQGDGGARIAVHTYTTNSVQTTPEAIILFQTIDGSIIKARVYSESWHGFNNMNQGLLLDSAGTMYIASQHVNSLITSEYRVLQVPLDLSTSPAWSIGSILDNADNSWAIVFGETESVVYQFSR